MPSIPVISPATQNVLFEMNCMPTSELDNVIQSAQQGAAAWRKVPVANRIEILKRFCDLFRQKGAAVGESITMQMGRPSRYASGEISGVLERAEYMISVADECLRDEVIEDSDMVKRYLRKEPLGVVYIIAAWNYPYLTAVNNVVPALLAGNAVLLKHSPLTPNCTGLFVDTLHEAGVPADVIQAVYADDEGADYVVRHPKVNFVNFTGSVAVGKKIRRTVANRNELIGSAMELGGKDPAYVRPDVDLDAAVENVVDGAFFNSGQCCCSIERCYVHEDVYDAFVEKAVALTKTYVLGDPRLPETTLGPMANQRFADQVRLHLKDAVDKGAKLCIEPSFFEKDKEGTPFVGPQIVTNVTHDMILMREETFGPVLPIMKVSSDSEAIQWMNDSSYGLTASVWTKDAKAAVAIGNELETGTFFMNRCDYIDPALAWVGVKDSGLGFSMSKQGFNQFVRPKSYHVLLV